MLRVVPHYWKTIKKITLKEFSFLLVITILSLIPRILALDSTPIGLHGDEAWNGINARIILNTGSIAPYVESANGNPTGPLYVTALSTLLFGESVYSLRLSMALFGVITIPLFYLFLRTFFNMKVSFITTILFSFSLMHLHYSRMGHTLIAAPVFEILSLVCLHFSIQRKNILLAGCAGFFSGIGLYTYSTFLAYPVFILLLYAFLFIMSKNKKFALDSAATFLGLYLLTILPLLKLMIFRPEIYFHHHKSVSIFNSAEFLSYTRWSDKILYFLTNGFEKISHFLLGGYLDRADGFGSYHTFGLLTIILAFFGIVIIIIHKKTFPLFMCSLAFCILMTSFLSIDGTYRRLILFLVPFYFFVGYFIYWITSLKKSKLQRLFFCFLVLFFIIFSSFNLYLYFYKFPADADTKNIFGNRLTAALVNLKQGYNGEQVYFYSSQWSCRYETARYLLPDLKCLDMSKEFNEYNGRIAPHSYVVLLREYLYLYPEIKSQYPLGITHFITDPYTGETIGVVYKTGRSPI